MLNTTFIHIHAARLLYSPISYLPCSGRAARGAAATSNHGAKPAWGARHYLYSCTADRLALSARTANRTPERTRHPSAGRDELHALGYKFESAERTAEAGKGPGTRLSGERQLTLSLLIKGIREREAQAHHCTVASTHAVHVQPQAHPRSTSAQAHNSSAR